MTLPNFVRHGLFLGGITQMFQFLALPCVIDL